MAWRQSERLALVSRFKNAPESVHMRPVALKLVTEVRKTFQSSITDFKATGHNWTLPGLSNLHDKSLKPP